MLNDDVTGTCVGFDDSRKVNEKIPLKREHISFEV